MTRNIEMAFGFYDAVQSLLHEPKETVFHFGIRRFLVRQSALPKPATIVGERCVYVGESEARWAALNRNPQRIWKVVGPMIKRVGMNHKVDSAR